MGFHGRRRAGHGENFWQYRQAVPGDPRSAVDWRRSGKSDQQFIREMEWEAAQTVSIWVDDALSMDYRDAEHVKARSKGERAALLALARLGAADQGRRAGGADGHRRRAAARRPRPAQPHGAGARRRARATTAPTTARRRPTGWRAAARAVFFSDFLGDVDAMKPALAHAADQGVRGCFVQVLDESEEVFPVRRPGDLREHGRHHRVRDPAGAGAARGLCRAAGRAPGEARRLRPPPRLAHALPPHQPAAAAGAALALHGGRRASVTDDRVGRLPRAVAAARARRPADPLVAAARVPPAPGRRAFPGVRLLLGLDRPREDARAHALVAAAPAHAGARRRDPRLRRAGAEPAPRGLVRRRCSCSSTAAGATRPTGPAASTAPRRRSTRPPATAARRRCC